VSDQAASAPLSASVTESLRLTDSAGSTIRPLHAVVAVLDALGAADYSRDQVDQFLETRSWLLVELPRLLKQFLPRYSEGRLRSFTFNDSVIIAYLIDDMTVQSVAHFESACHMLRGFQTLSLGRGILFRGAFAVGEVYRASTETNTIMGPAVSDAAAWYGLSDWVGLSATPLATIFFDALIPQLTSDLEHLLVPYSVPLRDGRRLRLRAVNWPKGFFVTGLVPEVVGAHGKARLRTLLSQQRIPRGSESKYNNTIEFFDYTYDLQNLARFEAAMPSPAAQATDAIET
jgi:hypothetical protein